MAPTKKPGPPKEKPVEQIPAKKRSRLDEFAYVPDPPPPPPPKKEPDQPAKED